MNIPELYSLFLKYPRVVTDSRKLIADSLFFALRGENFDGNVYAPQAIAGGCAYAIVDNAEFADHERCILVSNVLLCLQDLAAYHREQLRIPVLAITGTNGKTTTKELCGAVLARKYRVTLTQGNLNNHIGVPLTLLSITPDTEIAIIEMGANHAGEISTLCRIAAPDFGLITNVGKAHLEGFGSFEGVMRVKSELYKWLALNDGKAFVNADNENLLSMLGTQCTLTYGQTPLAERKGSIKHGGFFLGAELELPISANETKNVSVQTRLLGNYNFENVLAAATIGSYFGVDAADIKTALEEYTPTNNRSQLLKTATNTLLLDAYNANPTSMRLAIQNFAGLDVNAKILVLGDMFELGVHSAAEHQMIADQVGTLGFRDVYLLGKAFADTQHEFTALDTTAELCDLWRVCPPRGAHILIKGSRGMRLEQLTELL